MIKIKIHDLETLKNMGFTIREDGCLYRDTETYIKAKHCGEVFEIIEWRIADSCSYKKSKWEANSYEPDATYIIPDTICEVIEGEINV